MSNLINDKVNVIVASREAKGVVVSSQMRQQIRNSIILSFSGIVHSS